MMFANRFRFNLAPAASAFALPSVLGLCIVFHAAHRDARADTPAIAITDQAPALSLESLYHPEKRFSYTQSPTPMMRWDKTPEGQVHLLIRREGGWQQLEPASGTESPATVATQLETQLRSLEGVDEKAAKRFVGGWLANPNQSLDRGLVRIGDGIALIGRTVTPRWVTRSAADWREYSLSPDAESVAYVVANDLYVHRIADEKVTRLTNDGTTTQLNGILDWVYQEELYGRGNFRGYWWSPDSKSIAFLKLDNSKVATFTYTGSGQPRGEVYAEKYPKAGDPTTQAEIWCVHLPTDAPESEAKPFPLLNPSHVEDRLITRVGWEETSGQLLVQTANRVQSEVMLYRVDVHQPESCERLIDDRCDKWIETLELPQRLKSGDYLRLSDLPEGRRRLWKISADGKQQQPLTPPNFDVRELVHVDDQTSVAYVTGDIERGTVGQQLYRVDLQGSSPMEPVTRDANWHVVNISPDANWFIDRTSTLTTPVATFLKSLVTNPSDSRAFQTSQGRLLNQERIRLSQPLLEVTWPRIETPDGLVLPAALIKPKTDASSSKRFPVLVETYGGPLAPTVKDGWIGNRFLAMQWMAMQGIAVLMVDNRSSGGRGLQDSWSIHRRMGEVETEDMATVAQWLKGQEWVDGDKLAIRGWSFGGFLTLHTMTHSNHYAAGLAGGSVTNWHNYDSIYTERYMDVPQNNAAGYAATSPLKAAKQMHGRVLLLHGEMDDNVHLANAMQMAGALQAAAIPFEMMVYPGAGHAVHDPWQNYHLMQTSVDFLRRTFQMNSRQTHN